MPGESITHYLGAGPVRPGRQIVRLSSSEALAHTDELYALREACAALGNKNGAERHLAAGFIPVESAVPQT